MKVTKKTPEYVDLYESCTIAILEKKDENDFREVEGVASEGDVLNRNLRYYPTTMWEKCSKTAKKEKVEKNRFVGEVDHPWGVRSDLKDVAVLFTDLWMEGNFLKFKGKILKNEKGKHLESLLEGGVAVGVSTRGYGSTKFEKKKFGDKELEVEVIQDDFVLTGIDFVLDPSNVAGEVTKFESEEGIELEIKTVEQMKVMFPDLCDQLVASAVSAAKAEVTAQAKTDTEKAVSEAVEAALVAYKGSDEAKRFESAFQAVIATITPFLPEGVKMQESDLAKENTALKAKLDAEVAKATTLESTLTTLQAGITESQTKAKVAEAVEAKLKGHKFADKLRPRLAACKTEAEVDEKFASEVAFLESLVTETPAGNGKTAEETPGGEKRQYTETEKTMRKLAGLKE